ncbi:hypothetical protein EDC96DRAFT_549793 [Choanephora cucurbitarum]|nr:hypothetical protein EDC96DRAFT_549793 [Choanephora cucurbitarum]
MSFSSGFELIIRLYLYNLHKSSRVTDFRITMTDHYLALVGAIYIYQSLGYTKHFIAAYNIKLGTKKCGKKCSYSASYIIATQSHIFTSVSDINLVFGLTCLSEFASSLFQISNMVVIVTHEELHQAVLYRLEGDRLIRLSLQMSMLNMHIQSKDNDAVCYSFRAQWRQQRGYIRCLQHKSIFSKAKVEDHADHFTRQDSNKSITDNVNIENNDTITSNEIIEKG